MRYVLHSSIAILACLLAMGACTESSEKSETPQRAELRRLPEPLPPKAGTKLDDKKQTIRARSVKSAAPQVPAAPTPSAGAGSFAGQKVTFLAISDLPLSSALIDIEEEFEAVTGAELELVLLPFGDVYLEYVNDAMSANPRYDGLLAGAWWIGALVEKQLIRHYDDFYGDPRFPAWDFDDLLDAPRALLTYDGRKYVMPLDHDCQILYYRRDLFADKGHQEAFAGQFGYPLAVPQTWSQFRDMAAYFNGKDLNGDGEADYGLSLDLRVGAQTMFHYMSFSAPFVIGPDNPDQYWFDLRSMEAVIDSPGHQRALEQMVELVQYGPREMLEWNLGPSWDLFLQGRAALTFTWANLAALAQQEGSKVKGQTASAVLPGTMEYYAVGKQRWIKTDKPNRVGDNTGGSWGHVISSHAKSPEATYYLLAMVATYEKSFYYVIRADDGIDPGRKSLILKPHGLAEMQQFVQEGWSEADVADLHAAVYQSFTLPRQFPYLRIPGAFSYWHILDTNLHLAASKQMSPADALRNTKIDYAGIVREHGMDSLKASYERSMTR